MGDKTFDNQEYAAGSGQSADPGDELASAMKDSSGEFIAPEARTPLSRGGVLMFALLVVGVAGTYLMYLRSGPKSATAATVSADASRTIDQFLGDGSARMQSMERMLRQTEKVVEQFVNYPSVTQVPLTDLRTNPFHHVSSKPEVPDQTDEQARIKREEERVATLKAVQNLQLQSVIVSDARKACMINNGLLTEGQQVEGFVVERIAAGGVVVRSGPYRFELKMVR